MSTEIESQVGDPAGTSGGKLDRRVMVIAGVVVLGAIMSILDITVVAVAQRTFQDIFGKSQAQVAWTSTGYTLALATVIPLTGWAADRFGTKRLYILAIVLFTAGSALCSTASSLEMLVGFRVLQGLGGGMLMPLGMTILTRAAGPERLGRVMAILGVPMPSTPGARWTVTRCTRPRASTSSACSCSRPASPCSCTACPRSRPRRPLTAPCGPPRWCSSPPSASP